MSKTVHFLAKAKEAHRRAALSAEPFRLEYEEIERCWLELVEQQARMELAETEAAPPKEPLLRSG